MMNISLNYFLLYSYIVVSILYYKLNCINGSEYDNNNHEKKLRFSNKRCGGMKHSHFTRPCLNNDTLCGEWNMFDKTFHPYGCDYEIVTPDQARKCLGNRTIAFIGDSQVRDLAVGVMLLLLGEDELSIDGKLDKQSHKISNISTFLGDVPFWNSNQKCNGFYSPSVLDKRNRNGFDFQVQFWSLFDMSLVSRQLQDILENRVYNDTVRPIDISFVSYGLHNWGWWDNSEGRGNNSYGKTYNEKFVNHWLKIQDKVKTPTVWMPMNNQCKEKLLYPFHDMNIQFNMVEKANFYTNKRARIEKFPYWDSAAVLRTSNRCEISADGLHVNMWVDLFRARMLFHHLCDHNWNWHGDIASFL